MDEVLIMRNLLKLCEFFEVAGITHHSAFLGFSKQTTALITEQLMITLDVTIQLNSRTPNYLAHYLLSTTFVIYI